jgi:O-antigen/teichoic acid export membrane protein
VSDTQTTGSSFFTSVGALTASRAVLVISQLVILPVIARFLSAEDFGTFALAMSVVIFSQVLSDAGLGRSLIRQPVMDDLEWTSVFWIICGVGVGLMAFLLLTAPFWARAFGLPDLRPLVAALSVIPFMSAMAAIPNARLERDHRFPTLAVIRMAAALLGLGVAVVMAVRGMGAWALVGQQVVIASVQLVGGVRYSAFRPQWAFAGEGIGGHMRFARDTIGASLLITAQRQLPLVLIGQILGAVPLGLFEMTRRLLNFPDRGFTGPASQVVYVRMAKALSDPEEVAAIYIATLRLFALVLVPPMAVLAATGDVIFPFALSERWAPVAQIFLLAALGYTLEAIVSSNATTLQVAGRTELRLRMQAEQSVLMVLTVAAAAPFGIEAVAAAISLFSLLFVPRAWAYVHRAVPFDRRVAVMAIGLTALASALGALAFRWLAGWLGFGPWAYAAGLFAATGLLWLLCAALQWPTLRHDFHLLKR